MNTDILITIAAMAIVTYATRAGGILLGARLPHTGRLRRALDALPAAVLTALIAPAFTAGPAEMIGGVVTALAVLRLPLLAAVIIGIATVALVRGFS